MHFDFGSGLMAAILQKRLFVVAALKNIYYGLFIYIFIFVVVGLLSFLFLKMCCCFLCVWWVFWGEGFVGFFCFFVFLLLFACLCVNLFVCCCCFVVYCCCVFVGFLLSLQI